MFYRIDKMTTGITLMLLALLGHFHCSNGKITPGPAYTMSPSDNAELTCISDLPRPRTFQWFKEGKELKTTPGQYDIKQNTESLEVVRIDEVDVGEYTCVDTGNGERASVILNAPAWSENNADMVKDKGNTFTIDCHAWGHPTPTITWFKDGAALTADGSHYKLEDKPTVLTNVTLKNGRLRITNAQPSDTGKYKCIAQGTVGDGHAASTSVRVKDPLAYLWPCLGILALLILLAIGIALFLFFRNKYKKEERKRRNRWKKEAEKQRQTQQVFIAK